MTPESGSGLILPKQELIESLFDWEAVELDPQKFPDWVTQGFFLRMGRTLGTGKRLLRLGHLFEAEIHQRARENPDYIYGPAHKGIAVTAATAFYMGREKRVKLGFDLPGDARVGISNVFRWNNWGNDILKVYELSVPFIEDSDALRGWAKEWASHLKRYYDNTGTSRYGFDTVVGDGHAIPAAVALAMELADSDPGIDPNFIIPRRSHEAFARAEQTYRERRRVHGDQKLAVTEASERLYMGRIINGAKYILVSPRKSGEQPRKGQPYSFGDPGKETANMLVVDDSILTGSSMNRSVNELMLRYPRSNVRGGFVAVHIQELGPRIRHARGDQVITSTQFIDKSAVPLFAIVNSEDIMAHAYSTGMIPEGVHKKFLDARQTYHVKSLPTYS